MSESRVYQLGMRTTRRAKGVRNNSLVGMSTSDAGMGWINEGKGRARRIREVAICGRVTPGGEACGQDPKDAYITWPARASYLALFNPKGRQLLFLDATRPCHLPSWPPLDYGTDRRLKTKMPQH